MARKNRPASPKTKEEAEQLSDSPVESVAAEDASRDGEQAQETPAEPKALKASCACGGDCRRSKVRVYNWLDDLPGGKADSEYVEVQFKNARKGYYRNCTNLPLEGGDLVAVEATPGHDIGTITLTGALAELRMRRSLGRNGNIADIKRVFRIAKPADIEKYNEARAREDDTMIRARRIAEDLKLNMKIGDVEYQGDGNKAIFYYIADERVDFRQLIKVLAETFKVRIEMKQIGARQEAGRIGGIGPCGRPLCCSLWMSNFVSVSTSAARYQDISLNPQKLAGQCAKLKCCLNFEIDTYMEASKTMPPRDVRLETADNTYYFFKSDLFNRMVTYSTDKKIAANLVTIPADRVFEVISMNKAGEKPLTLQAEGEEEVKPKAEFGDILGEEDDLGRFDKKKKKKKKSGNKQNQGQNQNQPQGEHRERGERGEKPADRQREQGSQGGGHSRNRKARNRRPGGGGDKDAKGQPQQPKNE